MADIFSPEKRSAIMSRIRSTGTAPEQRLKGMLRELLGGRVRIRQHVKELPGCPDFVIPRFNLAIFADGCFYHGCPKHGHNPKSRQEYWIPKLERNCRRDASNRRKLRALGYRVWRLWEHDLKAGRLERTVAVLGRRLARLAAGAR